jgi:WD40 repeat protein
MIFNTYRLTERNKLAVILNNSNLLDKKLEYISNPKELTTSITLTSYSTIRCLSDCKFATLTTIRKRYIAFATPEHIIEVHSFDQETVIQKLNGHTNDIVIIRHFNIAKRDYLVSTSFDYTCKIWDIKLGTCITNIISGEYIYPAMIVIDKLIPYIITVEQKGPMRVWNFKGSHIKDIRSCQGDNSTYINIWYDTENDKIYIINGNRTCIRLFDYHTAMLVKSFDEDSAVLHLSASVHYINTKPYLYSTNANGQFKIWDLSNDKLFKYFSCESTDMGMLVGLLVWNDRYTIAAGRGCFVICDLQKGSILQVKDGSAYLCCVDKIDHPLYGESLITCGFNGEIKIWIKT